MLKPDFRKKNLVFREFKDIPKYLLKLVSGTATFEQVLELIHNFFIQEIFYWRLSANYLATLYSEMVIERCIE